MRAALGFTMHGVARAVHILSAAGPGMLARIATINVPIVDTPLMTDSVLQKLMQWPGMARTRGQAADAGFLQIQVDVYFNRLPLAVFGKLVSGAVLLLMFIGDGSLRGGVLTWTGWLVSLCAALLVFYWRREQWLARYGAAGVYRCAVVLAALSGIVWAMGPCFMMLHASSSLSFACIMLIMAGMMNGGNFAYGTVPAANFYYLSAISLGLIVGFLALESYFSVIFLLVLAIYLFVMCLFYIIAFNDFIGRLKSERESQDTTQTVKILLNDYETLGSDFIWEVDENGCVLNPPQRLADLLGPDKIKAGARLADLFADGVGKNLLAQKIQERAPFRDLELALRGAAEPPVCWRLSAAPVRQSDGASWRMRGVATDVSATKAAEARIKHLAFYDALTGMPNRVLFTEILTRGLPRATPEQPLAVMYLDLDHFKMINDTLGHVIGDQLLEQMARRLQGCVGPEDTVSRLGGDEFAILLPACSSRDAARAVADRILAAASQLFSLGRSQVGSGVSIGIVMAPADGAKADELMKYADLALYSAKEHGRNQYRFFDSSMSDAAQRKMRVEMGLRQALEKNELALYYQPQVDIETNTIAGYEALMRWIHPVHGMIGPVEFIPVAEETGLIVDLGEWAIRQAVRDLATWPEHIRVAVNLSAAQLMSKTLIPTVVDSLKATGVAPRRLELEVTETVLLMQNEKDLDVLHALRQLGLEFALDDFGTGHSSLNYLLRFPFSKIKIDKSFVDNVDKNEQSRAIVHSVTSLATDLGMITTGEGIETRAQLDALRALGCTQAQGYLFSKPKPYSETRHVI